jgi:hypothetical protein
MNKVTNSRFKRLKQLQERQAMLDIPLKDKEGRLP